MKTRLNLKYSVNDCLWKGFYDSKSAQTPLNLISLTIFGNSKVFHTVLA